jgi:hypothetical protein
VQFNATTGAPEANASLAPALLVSDLVPPTAPRITFGPAFASDGVSDSFNLSFALNQTGIVTYGVYNVTTNTNAVLAGEAGLSVPQVRGEGRHSRLELQEFLRHLGPRILRISGILKNFTEEF